MAGQQVYVLVQEGDPRPAAVITDQQTADEWAASSAKRDYFAYIMDDYVDGHLNTVESDPAEHSNHGRGEDVQLNTEG